MSVVHIAVRQDRGACEFSTVATHAANYLCRTDWQLHAGCKPNNRRASRSLSGYNHTFSQHAPNCLATIWSADSRRRHYLPLSGFGFWTLKRKTAEPALGHNRWQSKSRKWVR